jgi:hypothetical protein
MKAKFLILYFCLLISIDVHAQLFGDILKAAGSIVKTGVQITTAPYQALVNTGKALIGNGSVNQIYKPYQDAAVTAGQTVTQTGSVLSSPEMVIMQKAQNFAAAVGGKPGEFIFDIGTFTNRYYSDLGISAVNNIGGVLQGQNIFQIAGAPLAAAVRAAREKYISIAQPIPQSVKDALKGYFSDATLARAKYTIGDIEITLPNFIGQGAKFFGNEKYAVTVDDIIVFNSDPGNYSDNPNWWAHEMTHVQQYENMGVETFAYNYIKDLGRTLEGEAINNANRITNSNYALNGAALKVGSFDMSGATPASPIDYQQNPELYVAQCIFPNDQFGYNYLVTNYGRIIAVNPLNGQWMHIGYATPPRLPNIAWSYDLPSANWSYAVGFDNNIYSAVHNNFGMIINWVIVGYVVKLT